MDALTKRCLLNKEDVGVTWEPTMTITVTRTNGDGRSKPWPNAAQGAEGLSVQNVTGRKP